MQKITAESLYSTGIERLSIPKDYDPVIEKDKLATHDVLLLSNRSFTRIQSIEFTQPAGK